MTNISEHAYAGVDPKSCMFGRWWFAGAVVRGEARFYAYDHGAGIPVRAPFNMAEAISEYWRVNLRSRSAVSPLTDCEVLEAVVRARRMGIDLGGRGKGFPEMIGLIEQPSVKGRVHVISGGARSRFSKVGDTAPQERFAGLRLAAPGTLLVWQVSSFEVC
jgi:hypothetical protein